MMNDVSVPGYHPFGNGRDRAADGVFFAEMEPPDHLRGIVHRFLEIKTPELLAEPYRFHALPDACTYVVLDQLVRDHAGVTRIRATSEELDLGQSFHFLNIRFLPGVWQAAQVPPEYGLIDSAYGGPLPLCTFNERLGACAATEIPNILNALVDDLVARQVVRPNPDTERIFAHMDDIHTVADMAEVCGLSARQLQRRLKQTTGFAPHDFLKVLRLQQSLRGEPSLSYADQSHFIHSFRKATGYTPGQYARKFDV